MGPVATTIVTATVDLPPTVSLVLLTHHLCGKQVPPCLSAEECENQRGWKFPYGTAGYGSGMATAMAQAATVVWVQALARAFPHVMGVAQKINKVKKCFKKGRNSERLSRSRLKVPGLTVEEKMILCGCGFQSGSQMCVLKGCALRPSTSRG